MAGEFTLGDVIRKARMGRRWNQTRLGAEAAKYQLRGRDVAINKSTVSKVEKDPYTSEFGTVWRLLAALHLKFSDVEKRVGHPFIDANRQPPVSPSHTPAVAPTRPTGTRDGHAFAETDRADQAPALPVPAAAIRKVAADLVPVVRARAAHLARAARKPPAAAHRDASRARAGRGRSRR